MEANIRLKSIYNNETHIPKVTVGIPVYNGVKFIREAIESVLDQDYEDYELLISDNASSDGTQEICQEYAHQDSRVKYIRHSSNMGSLNNFTYLLDHARGSYMAWLAYDDYLDTSYLRKLVRYLDENNDVILCSGDFRFIKDDNLVWTKCLFMVREDTYWPKARRALFYYHDSCLLMYGLFRKEILLNNNIYGKPGLWGISISLDHVFIERLSLIGRMVAIPEVLRTFRIHTESTATNDISKNSRFKVALHIIYLLFKQQIPLVISAKVSFIDKLLLLYNLILHRLLRIVDVFIPCHIIWKHRRFIFFHPMLSMHKSIPYMPSYIQNILIKK